MKVVRVELNEQQLALLDRTVARGLAPDRSALIRLALREQARKHRQACESVPGDERARGGEREQASEGGMPAR